MQVCCHVPVAKHLRVVRYVPAMVEPLKGKRGRPRWARRASVRHHLERAADEEENGVAAPPKQSKDASGVSKPAALKPITAAGRDATNKPAAAKAAAAATAAKPSAPKPAALEPAALRHAAPRRAAAATTGTAKALVSARPAQLSSAAAQLRRQAQPHSQVQSPCPSQHRCRRHRRRCRRRGQQGHPCRPVTSDARLCPRRGGVARKGAVARKVRKTTDDCVRVGMRQAAIVREIPACSGPPASSPEVTAPGALLVGMVVFASLKYICML